MLKEVAENECINERHHLVKGDVSHAFKTAKITVFDPMMCKNQTLSLIHI